MVRLRHVSSGAVVSVIDEKAARMGPEWHPLGATETTKADALRRRSTKK